MANVGDAQQKRDEAQRMIEEAEAEEQEARNQAELEKAQVDASEEEDKDNRKAEIDQKYGIA